MARSVPPPSGPVPLVLVVLDGFGLAPPGPHNAITLARTPHWTRFWEAGPSARLSASGEDVGLPDRLMGNSEVGHLNLGAGRIVNQPITRITRSIRDGTFQAIPAFTAACEHAKASGGALHLLGLISDGGVHSHLAHVPGFLALAKRHGIERVFVHAFLDGRDTPPTSGRAYLATLERMLVDAGVGRIATVCGRYFAMDRDQRWERVERAWRALVLREGGHAATAEEAIAAAYAAGVTDEFVEPAVIGPPGGGIADGDAVLHMNFRPDRARELTYALAEPGFTGFERPRVPKDLAYVCLTRYDEKLALPVAFPPEDIFDTLGDLYAAAGRSQLRIAETEKYAHVTYFFSGGREAPLAGEERCLVPSPRVSTYDLEPEMSASGVTDEVVRRLADDRPDLVVLNYANADMVGHTGVLAATVRAVETIDGCLARVEAAVRARDGILAITADHGNAEQMWDVARGEPHTAHTTNPVPFVLVGDALAGIELADGMLADVAPTLLDLVGVPQPGAMTGRSLLRRAGLPPTR
ncbi:MAG: 2,3-bisphosphoglycerate-independent phosphoglycerate mutase [Candidatus Eisenbacteria bacterium]